MRLASRQFVAGSAGYGGKNQQSKGANGSIQTSRRRAMTEKMTTTRSITMILIESSI
jgi:hypothetical protein